MDIPVWAFYALTSASLSAGVMLIQERIRLPGFVMAFWNKVACATIMLPLVLYFGAPDNPWFYGLLAAQAILWVVSDVIFFSAIPKVGAGVVSRLLPGSVIITFCLWFIIDPQVWHDYMQKPVISALIFITLCGSVFFAMRLRHCPVSLQALRLIWFVLFAAVLGPIMAKLVAEEATRSQGPFAFVFFEAALMVTMWLCWQLIKRPVPMTTLFSRQAAKYGFMVGAFSSFMVASNVAAVMGVDNPGLIPAVKFTDTMIIIAWYKFTGRREEADVTSGLGIVACAAALIILKSV